MACGFLCLFVFCWLMFVAVPRRQVRARFALFGAVFSALGWLLFSFFFSLFVENFANYATLYGGLAAVVILMMWLYFCMYIFFVGAEVNVWLQENLPKRKWRR
jgi:membrane protein